MIEEEIFQAAIDKRSHAERDACLREAVTHFASLTSGAEARNRWIVPSRVPAAMVLSFGDTQRLARECMRH
jgi:hypothetical protein